MDDDTARMAPAPQDPNPSNGGGYGKEDKGDEGGGVMMGGDVLGVGVAPSSFAAMAGGGGPSSSSGGTGMAAMAGGGGAGEARTPFALDRVVRRRPFCHIILSIIFCSFYYFPPCENNSR